MTSLRLVHRLYSGFRAEDGPFRMDWAKDDDGIFERSFVLPLIVDVVPNMGHRSTFLSTVGPRTNMWL